MKKIALIVLLALVGVTPNFANAFAGGDGSAGDPYQISTCLELQDMQDDITASYVLVNDIDCSATTGWNSGAGFVPVASTSAWFRGTFDGADYVISNLYINRPTTDYVGLFGNAAATEISNVRLEDVDIRGGKNNVGGLVGLFQTGFIIDSYTTGNVSSGTLGSGIGGLVGTMYGGNITKSYSSANVDATASRNGIGGLIGYAPISGEGTVANTYATGNITALDNSGSTLGGLIGVIENVTVTNSYSTGSVEDDGGSNVEGGIIGDDWWNGGGTNLFWDTQTSGMSSSFYGTGKTTAQMKDVATYTDTNTTGLTSAWDFLNDPNDDGGSSDYWAIDSTVNNGYPFLTAFYSAPGAPTALTANVQSYSQINLSWTAPADNGGLSVTGYKIERKIGSGSYSTLVADTGDTSTSYQDTGLDGSTLYTYKVSAISGLGAGTASSEASATTYAEPTGSVINIMRGSSDDSDDDTDEEETDEDEEEQDEEEDEETEDGEMTQERREQFQRQINELREIINQLIALIQARYGISPGLDF